MSATVFLTPFQRMLLGTDGTLTHILEVYADESIRVMKLLQEYDTTRDEDAPLRLPDDSKVLRRRVLLQGRRTGRNLLYAEAVVVPDRVSPAVLDGLLTTDKPIGTVLAENRTETFREILRVDQEPAGRCSTYFAIDPADPVILRTYRIVAGEQPIMLITERFPADFFRELPS